MKGLRAAHSRLSHGRTPLIVLLAIVVFTTSNVFSQEMPRGDGVAPEEELSHQHQPNSSDHNSHRGEVHAGAAGVGSEQEVLKNMRTLLSEIYLQPEQAMSPRRDLDPWFSPHLRDLDIPEPERYQQVLGRTGRGLAGSPSSYSWWGCTGACPLCGWDDEHRTDACCGVSTAAYGAMLEDSNFKACCVRKEDEMASMEDIACKHPKGDGWAGLFEYYFPTNMIGWESERGATMIATQDSVRSCMESSDTMMENSDWMTSAIEQRIGGTEKQIIGKGADPLIRSRSKGRPLRFSETVHGEGLTMRVNFAHMDPNERRALAVQFCMHPDQFMKLMDPEWDTKQMGGGPTLQALQALPIWATYCPEAVKLMTDQKENFKVVNTDGTKTNFPQGMAVFQTDPHYCQKMSSIANPTEGEIRPYGMLARQKPGLFTPHDVGYTCRSASAEPGASQTRMIPLSLNSKAGSDPGTLDHAIPFLHAAGYYQGEISNGPRSIYKRFEPLPYSQQLNLFTGKQWKGGGSNELNMPCRSYEGKNYEDTNRPDQLFLSDGNRKSPAQRRARYGAAFRIFATCPAGYVRWKGPHSERFAQACGSENFGGKPESP